MENLLTNPSIPPGPTKERILKIPIVFNTNMLNISTNLLQEGKYSSLQKLVEDSIIKLGEKK